MFSSTYLDVAIGLIFIFLLLSLLVTVINELIAGALRMRAQMLRKAIFYLLSDKNGHTIANKVYNHPLVNNPVDVSIIPSYISDKNFSKILIDIFTPEGGKGTMFSRFEQTVRELPNGEVKDVLLSFIKQSDEDFDKLKLHIEEWFNNSMDRITGWYKRKMQTITFVVGLCLCLVFNANTFSIIHNLVYDKEARQEMVSMAQNFIEHHPPYIDTIIQHQRNINSSKDTLINSTDDSDTSIEKISAIEKLQLDTAELRKMKELSNQAYDLIQEMNQSNNLVGLGWNYAWQNDYAPLLKEKCGVRFGLFVWTGFLNLIGIIITSLALLLGAPFWFDMLNKIVSIRNGGKKPADTTDKK